MRDKETAREPRSVGTEHKMKVSIPRGSKKAQTSGRHRLTARYDPCHMDTKRFQIEADIKVCIPGGSRNV